MAEWEEEQDWGDEPDLDEAGEAPAPAAATERAGDPWPAEAKPVTEAVAPVTAPTEAVAATEAVPLVYPVPPAETGPRPPGSTGSKARAVARSPKARKVAAVVVVAALVGAGIGIWDATRTSGGYRVARATSASISQELNVSGSVSPVNQGTADFQVEGTVTAVDVTVGQQVTAGQTVATIDPTLLQQTLTSAQSTLASDQAKLTEDEDAETDAAVSGGNGLTLDAFLADDSSSSCTATTEESTLCADVTTAVATENADEATATADLQTAQTACASSEDSTCEADLATAASDEQQVATDQTAIQTAENNLATYLSSLSTPTTTEPSSPTTTTPSGGSTGKSSGAAGSSSAGSSSSRSSAATGSGSSSFGSGGSGASGSGGTSAASDSAEQLATDQASIDTAEAQVVVAQQDLADANLAAPLSGTVASVGMSVGQTVSAGSSTDGIVILDLGSYQATTTLTSSQVADVKVGDKATAAVDGTTGAVTGTVARVGPVTESDDSYTYPLVVTLDATSQKLSAGSSAQIAVILQQVDASVAVPTSAVTTDGTHSSVEVMKAGKVTEQRVTVGVVGNTYTQVTSGLKKGAAVVLANLGEALPSSNSNDTTGLGGAGRGGRTFTVGGGGFGGAGGGGGAFTRAG